jgi:hypothetical protein
MRKHLNIPIDEFKNKVNAAFAEIESELRLNQVSAAAQNHSRTATISGRLVYMLWCAPKRRIITGLSLIGTGDGTPQSGVDIFYAIIATIMAVSGKEKESATKTAMDLVAQNKPFLTEIDGVKYRLTQNTGVGTWLTVGITGIAEAEKNEQT